jgi:hypothetical protein
MGCSPSSSKSLFQYALNGQSSTDFPNEQRSKGIIKSALLMYFSLNNISVFFVPVSPNSGKLQKKRGTVAIFARRHRQKPTQQISTAHAVRGRHTYIPVVYKNWQFFLQE